MFGEEEDFAVEDEIDTEWMQVGYCLRETPRYLVEVLGFETWEQVDKYMKARENPPAWWEMTWWGEPSCHGRGRRKFEELVRARHMPTPEQFRSKWRSQVEAKSSLPEDMKLLTFTSQAPDSIRLPESARRFLAEAGLPASCAPCLSFEEVGKGLPRIWEVFSPAEWRPEEKVSLEHFRMIGSDGSGNPFCVDERDGRVVMLDHELLFDPKARDARIMFVNSGIPELAECLLIFDTVSPQARLNAILKVDPPAASKGAFWFFQVDETPWWKFW